MDLEAIAPIIEQIIKDTLSEKRYPFGFANYRGTGNKVASGKLRDSIHVEVMTNNSISYLQIIMTEYAQYVQSGRLPGKKGVPIQPLLEWIKYRNIKGRNAKGRFITNKSLAFAIRNNIKKFGIRPSNFLDISIEKIFEDPRIIGLIGDQSYEELITYVNKNKNDECAHFFERSFISVFYPIENEYLFR